MNIQDKLIEKLGVVSASILSIFTLFLIYSDRLPIGKTATSLLAIGVLLIGAIVLVFLEVKENKQGEK